MMPDEKQKLTFEEAVALLPDGDMIHTFRSTSIALIGADWDREDLIAAIKKGKPELAGQAATAMRHGLVIFTPKPLFIATK